MELVAEANLRRPDLDWPSASVIVPVRNHDRWLGTQLAALAAQDYPGFVEVLVVNNRSTDSSSDVARSWVGKVPHLEVVDAADVPGPGATRNVGASRAGGEIVAFCDADDAVSPGWLAALAPAARSNGLATGPVDLCAFDPIIRREWVAGLLSAPPVALNWLPYALGANLAVRRSVFDAVGGFDEEILVSEDVDLSWRIQLAGYQLAFVPEALVNKRPRSGSKAIWAQAAAWGEADIGLERRFRPMGLPPIGIRPWREGLPLVATMPLLALPAHRRGWLERAGRMWGRSLERRRERPIPSP